VDFFWYTIRTSCIISQYLHCPVIHYNIFVRRNLWQERTCYPTGIPGNTLNNSIATRCRVARVAYTLATLFCVPYLYTLTRRQVDFDGRRADFPICDCRNGSGKPSYPYLMLICYLYDKIYPSVIPSPQLAIYNKKKQACFVTSAKNRSLLTCYTCGCLNDRVGYYRLQSSMLHPSPCLAVCGCLVASPLCRASESFGNQSLIRECEGERYGE